MAEAQCTSQQQGKVRRMSRSHQQVSGRDESGAGATSARLTCVPLHRHVLRAAGRTWQIDAVRDQDALLAASEHFEAFPYGLLLWESALVLADALSGLAPLAGKRVLELGAGVGLAGLAARVLGAEVVQSDHAAEALELCRRNAALNGIEGVRQVLADWTDWTMQDRFDLIIGSDILYDGSAHAPIINVLDAALAAGGGVLLTDPGRTATPYFIGDIRAAGWSVDTRVATVDALHPVRPNETVDITIVHMVRR